MAPTLHGGMWKHGDHVSESFDIWDSVAIRDLRDGQARVLFGSGNGAPTYESNHRMSFFDGMRTSAVKDIYARTNLSSMANSALVFTRALMAWMHATVVTVIMNGTPIMQGSLKRMMGPHHDNFLHTLDVEEKARVERHCASLLAKAYGTDLMATTAAEGDRWMDVASVVQQIYGNKYRLTVPPRALVKVHIEPEPRSTGALLEVMPAVAPDARLWIHFTGKHVLC